MKNTRDMQAGTQRQPFSMKAAVDASAGGPVLITGGSGFIGTNLADRLLQCGRKVYLFDNLSRPGVEKNLQWLRARHGNLLEVAISDTQDVQALSSVVKDVRQVFHCAAQVAVTSSVTNPMHDFHVNARGTLNLLEAMRSVPDPPSIVYTSTNKVYGALDDLKLVANRSHYRPASTRIRAHGISEMRSLDFHRPYGCSKGAADQYVLDYARTFSVPGVVFRMSCIYGPHQFGTEDQGWIAYFLLCALENKPITIYGDGKQVRDVLFVDDLVDALILAQKNIQRISGEAFNMGGGPANSLSLLELLDLIEVIHGERPAVRFDGWRVGDQRYYVSDIGKFHQATGWSPRTGMREGVERLYNWLRTNHPSFSGNEKSYTGVEDYEILAR